MFIFLINFFLLNLLKKMNDNIKQNNYENIQNNIKNNNSSKINYY